MWVDTPPTGPRQVGRSRGQKGAWTPGPGSGQWGQERAAGPSGRAGRGSGSAQHGTQGRPRSQASGTACGGGIGRIAGLLGPGLCRRPSAGSGLPWFRCLPRGGRRIPEVLGGGRGFSCVLGTRLARSTCGTETRLPRERLLPGAGSAWGRSPGGTESRSQDCVSTRVHGCAVGAAEGPPVPGCADRTPVCACAAHPGQEAAVTEL